jgi:protein required for attachment to host cells
LVINGTKLEGDKSLTLNHEKSRKLSHEIGTDKPGRGFDSAGMGKHAFEPKTDLHEKVKFQFAEHIANILNDAAVKEEFDNLIIAASPEFLGEIRTKLKKPAIGKIANEVNKDLTELSTEEALSSLGLRVAS